MALNLPDKKQTDEGNIFKTGKVIVLSASHFIHDIYASFLSPLLPLLIEKFSITLAQAGFLSTIMQVPALFNPFLGILADRTSVRFFIILAPVTTAVPMSLLGLAPSYSALLLLLFITGISTSIFHVPAPVMVAHVSGNQKGKGMSFFMTGGELARTIGPVVAIGAVSISSLEGYYPVMLLGIMASTWLFFKFRDIPIRTEQSKRQPFLSTLQETRHILLPLTAIIIARGFMHASMTTFLPTFLKQETGSFWLAGTGLAVTEGIGVVGILFSGTLSDRFGRKTVLFIALSIAPLSMMLFITTSGYLRVLMLLITGLTLFSTTPIMLTMIQENAKNSPAAANGVFMMVSFIARSGIVILVGAIGDYIGLHATYTLCALLGFLGLPFLFLIKENKR